MPLVWRPWFGGVLENYFRPMPIFGPLKALIKAVLRTIKPLLDVVLAPLTFLGACYFYILKRAGLKQMRVSRSIFYSVGMYPIIDHYYEPLFNPRHLSHPLNRDRLLPGLDFNVEGQLALLSRFTFTEEVGRIPLTPAGKLTFHFHNGSYESGDAEFLYQCVRLFKPSNIVEIGCGQSTLLIQQALSKNREENPAAHCAHTCIEPYESPWLEQLPVTVKRSRVEDLPADFFSVLKPGDILFIDSSHVVRPQGDVVYEYLQLLPSLPKGVLVHVHDIFTPRDYPREWIVEEGRIWTEQYLLEAFLSHNAAFRVIGALNYLHHNHRDALGRVAPILAREPDREPGAFWIEKVL